MSLEKAIEFLRNTPHPRAKYDEVVVQRVIADIRAIRGESMTEKFGELREAIKRIQGLRWSLKTNLANGVSLSSLHLENAWHIYAKVKAALGEAYYSDECRRIVEEGFGHPIGQGGFYYPWNGDICSLVFTTTSSGSSTTMGSADSSTPEVNGPIQIY